MNLGRVLAWFGQGFGKGLKALGGSWTVFWLHFFVLVSGMVFKRALGGLWARFWFDFKGFGKDFGRVLGRIFEHSGWLWAIRLAATSCGLLWLALTCFRLLWLAVIYFGLLWISLACFGLELLVLSRIGLAWLGVVCFGVWLG